MQLTQLKLLVLLTDQTVLCVLLLKLTLLKVELVN